MRKNSDETTRLLGVLDKQLGANDYIIEEYSISDIDIFQWVFAARLRGRVDSSQFPLVSAWLERLGQRSAIIKSYNIGDRIRESI